MRNYRHVLPVALAVALSACAATDTGAPVLPGYVNAPPPPMAAPGDTLLTNTPWAWQGTQMKDGTRIVAEAPERYTLTFQPGGQVNVRADCNRGSGSYSSTTPRCRSGRWRSPRCSAHRGRATPNS